MLPSGNDAAHQLAEYFGGILKKESDEKEVIRLKELKEKQLAEEEKRLADLAYKEQMEAAAAAVLAAAKLSNSNNEDDENASLPTAETNNTTKGEGAEPENISSNENLNN